ncbi:deiodinase-like protein [Haloferax sp. DFSO52]|uniref:deiodinase-like protein n=1 Tax=Haloferax sp. DFSO52 TaxID=3388505 RepID=UPI003A8C7098
MRSKEPYNYRHFRVEHYFDGTRTPGVRAGDSVSTHFVETLDGDTVKLDDCWSDSPAVIEFGSVSCPLFQANIDRVNRLAAKYGESVNFCLVYVREAHPGARVGPHNSITDKRELANDVAPHLENRTVLVDDVQGSVHRAFDAMPNSVHLVGTDGIVAYRADWLHAGALDDAIDALLDAGGDGAATEHEDVTNNFFLPSPAVLRGARRAFGRAGDGSAADFVRALPKLAWHRLRH